MDTLTLKQALKQVLHQYTGEALNGYSYLTSDPDGQVFASVTVGRSKGKEYSFVDLVIRLVADTVVIDKDANSDPLYEALLQAGVPREQIILAYAGEPVPETA